MLKKTTIRKRVRFNSSPKQDEFLRELKKRVDHYFHENKISKHANPQMVWKSIIGFGSWLLVYALIMSNLLSQFPLLLILAFTLLGFVNIFLAFNVMHDGTHEAYTDKRKLNKLLGYTFNFIGGNQYLFRLMHGAHHGFVNIQGIDVTLETHGLFRFTPHEPYKWYHRYQHFYTPVLYMFAHIHWVFIKDFKWFFVERSIGNVKNIKTPFKEYVILIGTKVIYLTLTLALPIIFLSAPVWLILLGFVSIHILPSLTFALIFQVTHVFEGTSYPEPDNNGIIDNSYAIHVLETTADFSRNNKTGRWLMGCINIHVIHHIFPEICHIHYPALTEILIDVANDFGLEYKENKTFWIALKKHIWMLKELSNPPAPELY
ncbi:fatty acid desaturase family protein [Maribellus mangrovi]|uniref:fatty acid desaturase family protein n=1 Tax=Maribellus mangrovi TaxID=3133146 RepID=UPI0030ED7624